jgi:hypothetical protein
VTAAESLSDDQFSAHVDLPMGVARRALISDHDPGRPAHELPGSHLLQRSKVYKLQRSIKEEGLQEPLHFSAPRQDDERGEMILNDGHHRMEALMRNGATTVPAVVHYPNEHGDYPTNPVGSLMYPSRRRPQ